MFKHPRHTSHPWIILFTTLALIILYPIENSIRRPSREAESTLVPVFSLPGGYYDRDIRLKISVPGVGKHSEQHDVIFTIDGNVPTLTAGTTYTQPILMSADTPAVTVIRACTVLPGDELGPVISASYIVGVRATLPIISLIVAPDDLRHPEYGIDANSYARGRAWERPADVTYVDKDRRSGFHVPAGVRIHGGESRNSAKKPLRLYFRQEYGISRLEYPLFADDEGAHSSVESFKRLVLHNGGQDWYNFPHVNHPNWTLMRNQLAANLAFQLDGHTVRSQPVLLFINGESWGIYYSRERIDQHFLADHYGIEAADLLETPELIGYRTVRVGDGENWDQLMQFVETHDLADPANYAYAQSQVDIANFIDYYALQIYTADADWPHHNVYQFRPRVQGGRWRWIFWDSDHGFGANQRSRADTNMIERLLDYNSLETGGRDMLLLRGLLKNPVFLDQFLSRTADLLNTTLAPQSVIVRIDALAAELAPDISYETIRWSSSVSWASNVQALRDFARRRPNIVRQHVVERFSLGGTTQITFAPPANGSGSIAVNGSLLPELPWSGVYFQGISVQLTAAPAPGFRFAGWEPSNLPQTPTITLTANATRTIAPRFEPINDNAPQPGDVAFGAVEKDRLELRVLRSSGVDLRGWRVTDNDTKTATDEGSLIFTDNRVFTHVPQGTIIQIILMPIDGTHVPLDDPSTWDRRMILHAANGDLDTETDPGFNLGPNDNLVLLAPGPTPALDDDQGIAFASLPGTASHAPTVTPASFGVLADGVWY